MKMMRILTIVAVAQGSLAFVRQTASRTHRNLPVEQDDEEVVRVVEPDVITDESENIVRPTKALAQKAAKIVGSAKIEDNGAQMTSDSDFFEARISTGASSDASSSSDANSDEVVEVAGVTPDIVQDLAASAQVPTEKQYQGKHNMVRNKPSVDAKELKPFAKRASAVQVAAPKVKIAALAPAKFNGSQKDGRLSTATKQLKALAIKKKKHLRGPETDDDDQEYVDPSQVQADTDDDRVEEFVSVQPGKMPNLEAEEEHAPQPQVQETSKDSGDDDGDKFVNNLAAVYNRPPEQVAAPKESLCDQGSEFNVNDC